MFEWSQSYDPASKQRPGFTESPGGWCQKNRRRRCQFRSKPRRRTRRRARQETPAEDRRSSRARVSRPLAKLQPTKQRRPQEGVQSGQAQGAQGCQPTGEVGAPSKWVLSRLPSTLRSPERKAADAFAGMIGAFQSNLSKEEQGEMMQKVNAYAIGSTGRSSRARPYDPTQACTSSSLEYAQEQAAQPISSRAPGISRGLSVGRPWV